MAEPEKIKIASLQIDVTQILKESAKYRGEISKLKQQQKALDVTTEEGQIAYERYTIQIKDNQKALRDSQKATKAVDAANEDLNETMSTQGKTTQELADSRARLTLISRNIKGDTEEEIKARERINKAADEQTEAIRNQSSAYVAGKDSIGEYKKNIISAYKELQNQANELENVKKELKDEIKAVDKSSEKYKELSVAIRQVDNDLEDVNGQIDEASGGALDLDNGISGFIQSASASGGATGSLAKGLSGASSAMLKLVRSSLAFIATPIGAILAVLVGAFLLIKNAMDRNAETSNKLTKAVSGISGVFSGLLKALEPLGEFLVDVLVGAFDALGDAAEAAGELVADALNFLGFKDAAKAVSGLNEELKQAAKAAKDLAAAELERDKAQRSFERTQLRFQNQAEKLRQLRDDERKTTKERIKANEDLGKILDEQAKTELKLAQNAVTVAEKKILLNGRNKETLDEEAEALLKIDEINERITSQRSEQLTERNALLKEANEKAIQRQNLELEIFIKSQGVKAKTLEEELIIERQVAEKKKNILRQELAAKLKTREEYQLEVLGLENDLLLKQAELTAENAERELNAYIKNNDSKLEADQQLTAELVAEEENRLNQLAVKRREFEAERLEVGVINQNEYNDAINTINAENEAAIEELKAQKKEQEAEEKEKEAEKEAEEKEAAIEASAVDFQNQLEINRANGQSEFDLITKQLEEKKKAEIDTANAIGASTDLIESKFAAIQGKRELELKKQRLSVAADTFGGVAELFGEQTIAAKSAGVAQATINTYLGVSEVLGSPSVLPEPFGTIGKIANSAVILGSGLKTVANIRKLKKGGVLEGDSHENGGIPFSISGKTGFEAEGGEAVINKRSTAMFMPLLSEINQAGGGAKFADGGVLGNVQGLQTGVDLDTLVEKMTEANAALPAPIVSVVEINEVAEGVQVIENEANFS